jgi:hypothetical protein
MAPVILLLLPSVFCLQTRYKLESRVLPMLFGSEALDLQSDTLEFSVLAMCICTVEGRQR